MGVYIKSMKMPTRCYTCPCADLEFYDCNLMPGTRIEQHKRLDDCPLVPVPPHGRLIDADEMKGSIRKQTAFLRLMGGELAEIGEILEKGFLQEIDNALTIIPAEEEV